MKDHSDISFQKRIRSTTLYWTGVGVLIVGLSYSAVPLYRMFCQVYDCNSLRITINIILSNLILSIISISIVTVVIDVTIFVILYISFIRYIFSIIQSYSYGGTISAGHDTTKVSTMSPVNNRKIKIKFSADTAASMQWNFKPQQTEITVVPGETALAFYTATNPTNERVIGISTYNVLPFEVGQYFNKIQCFCFEEQMLNPHEQVSLLILHIE